MSGDGTAGGLPETAAEHGGPPDQDPAADEQPVVAGRPREGMFGVTGPGDTSGYGGLRVPAYVPPAAERPFGGWFDEVADGLFDGMSRRGVPSDAVLRITVDRGEITFYVDRRHLLEICRTFRDEPDLRFEFCSSLSGVDYGPDVPQRLHSVCHLTSMTYRRRIRVEVAVDVADPRIPSVVEVYPTADFQEREAWDMYGIVYDDHPSLTRILMPDDWEGHPQRKDYPLGGIPVEYKGEGAEVPPPDQRRSYT
ncbi:NADH-quinone oxidoreductase subunit C [Actinopolyspora saharensis]|uniref:NADH-quinone oxidoreductase subunit C n=1 Tax=Actinopolyspora saharensis TaxID=995062 RepID=A0A1H1GEH1_9ACTN|nr:NADH-quinone oxidoreductase subunit C [Actinopolyspora saharensis]SDR11483.1 NADH dehydrogenase subunit C [Actinopolyspora saharensis]